MIKSETKQTKHTNIWDFRSNEAPLNNFLLSCEHASDNLHEYKQKLTKEDLPFTSTHWAVDIGAKDLSIDLSKELHCILIAPNFSRLILDPNRMPLSDSLIRRYVDSHEFSINRPDVVDRKERLESLYYPYIEELNSLLQRHRPDFFISIHSFTPYYEREELRDFQVGLLFTKRGEFFQHIERASLKAILNMN